MGGGGSYQEICCRWDLGLTGTLKNSVAKIHLKIGHVNVSDKKTLEKKIEKKETLKN